MLIRNGQSAMMARCILTELLQCTVHEKYLCQHFSEALGRVYTGLDPFGTGTKLARINSVFTRDFVDPVWIGSAICYQNGPTYEGDPI